MTTGGKKRVNAYSGCHGWRVRQTSRCSKKFGLVKYVEKEYSREEDEVLWTYHAKDSIEKRLMHEKVDVKRSVG